MKLLRCWWCGDVLALAKREVRQCDCGRSFGRYNPDGDTVAISADPNCRLFGLDNRVFIFGRAEAWAYDESNGKVTRVADIKECR